MSVDENVDREALAAWLRGATGRRVARWRALQVLFEADIRHQDPAGALIALESDPRGHSLVDPFDESQLEPQVPFDRFTRSLVLGVDEHRGEVDATIDRFARGWTVARMPVVDRNVLRLGVFELLHGDAPAAVAIDEAVELVKILSTADSPRFVNGVLEAVRRERGAAREP